jgi:hypothetical protein
MSAIASPELRVSVVRSLEALSAQGPAYPALLQRVPHGRGLFFSVDWLRTLAPAHLLPGRSLYFMLAWRDAQLIGVAPMVIDQRPWVRGHVRRLCFWGVVPGSLRLEGDFLVPQEADVEPCLRAFMAHVRQPGSPVDYLDLHYFRDVSACQAAFSAVTRLMPVQREDMVSHWARLAPTFDEYCATLKKSTLGKVLNRVRAIERDLGTTLTCVTRLSEDELAQVETLHVQRQRELMGRGRERHSLFEIEHDRRVYRALLEQAARDGTARHYLLKSQDRIVAFALCFHFGRTLFFHLTSFDSAHAKYEPGRVLMLLKVQAEIRCGDTDHIDMLPGTTKIKEDFGNQVFNYHRYSAVNETSLKSRIKCGVWQAQAALAQKVRRA